MKIKPLFDKVVLKEEKLDETTKSGIIIAFITWNLFAPSTSAASNKVESIPISAA